MRASYDYLYIGNKSLTKCSEDEQVHPTSLIGKVALLWLSPTSWDRQSPSEIVLGSGWSVIVLFGIDRFILLVAPIRHGDIQSNPYLRNPHRVDCF